MHRLTRSDVIFVIKVPIYVVSRTDWRHMSRDFISLPCQHDISMHNGEDVRCIGLVCIFTIVGAIARG